MLASSTVIVAVIVHRSSIVVIILVIIIVDNDCDRKLLRGLLTGGKRAILVAIKQGTELAA